MANISRRRFLRMSSGAAAAAGMGAGCSNMMARATAPKILASSRPGKATPGDTVVIGFIGVAGRGSALMREFMKYDDVRVAAICDVYKPHLEKALAATQGKAKGYSDFRRVLDRKDLDAVVIAPPPHWHALMTVLACQAGKDVYCEKPMCRTPIEGRAMVKAARLNHRVTQIGTQIHADENYHRVVEIVRSGMLGDISAVRTLLSLNEAPDGIGFPPDTDPPDDLDWDMWIGPNPEVPFNIGRFKDGQHRYFADIVGSWLHEMGPHIVDLPFWALQLGPPRAVSASGGKFATKDISTIPDTMEAAFEFDNLLVTWSNMCANSFGGPFHAGQGLQRRLGITFHGVNGTLKSTYHNHELIGEASRIEGVELPEKSLPRSPGHQREFLDCVKSRALPSCDVSYHYNVHVALNLGNASYALGRKLHWDEATGTIVGDREANEYIQPHYRKPWELPV